MPTGRHVRICPVCGSEHAPETAQCGCGVLLAGIDLSWKEEASAAPPAAAATGAATGAATDAATDVATDAAAPAGTRCPHADCGMDNPPDASECLYCGRPLTAIPATPAAAATHLYNLPASLRDKFRIERVLPAGGAEAEIMVVVGSETGARAVAKLYRPGIQPKSEVLERVSRVAFAHTVRLIAHGVSDGIAWELMEYCPGGSLRTMMADGPMADTLARRVLVELTAALEALHAQDIIHRDLKPENVLVRRHEPLDLVLTDFGIASLRAQTQVFTGIARSTLYAAPEALSGVLEPAADYWSLGVILLEALVGRHPFAGLSEPVIAHRLVTGGVPVEPTLPAHWRKLLRGLLQRDPRQRWQAAEVRRWLAGDPELPEPASEGARAQRSYRIGEDEAATATDLAVLLARHWSDARKDVARGQVASWIEQLGEQNLTRAVHDLMDERGLSDDLRLFRLLRLLAPAMPPVWREGSLTRDQLLAQAARAEQGDGAAAFWLASLYDNRVLALLPDLAAIDADWRAAVASGEGLWQRARDLRDAWQRQRRAQGSGLVDYDALVFGHVRGLEPPPRERLLAGLLLALIGPESPGALAARARAKLVAALGDQPWLEGLLDAAELQPRTLLFILAAADEALAQENKHAVRTAPTPTEAPERLIEARTIEVLARLRASVDSGLFGFPDAGILQGAIDDFQLLSIEARQQGIEVPHGPWRHIARAEPIVWRMQEKLQQWQRFQRMNELMRNRHVANTLVGIIFIGVMFMPALLPWLFGIGGSVVFWRLLLARSLRHELRQLRDGLPALRSSPLTVQGR